MALIIFDLDGTLAKTNEDIADAVNEVRQVRGLQPLSYEKLTSMLGCGIFNLMKQAMPELHSDEEIQKTVDEQVDYYDKCYTNKTRLYPGVAATLEELSRRHTLAVCTNKLMRQAQEILRLLGVAQFFKCIIGNQGSIPLKPDAAAVQYVANEAGCSLEGSWIVGDNWTDLQTGLNAGIKSCFCQYGFGNARMFAANASISSFDLLTKVIK